MAKITIPNEMFGRKLGEDLIEKVLSKQNPQPKIIKPSAIENQESYIILPGKTYNNYSYPDVLVSKERSYHNNNWHKSHELLNKDNSFMLTIRQFVDFLNLLKSGEAYNGKGTKINKKELDDLFDEITKVKDPARAEWLDADFKVINDTLHINYEHKLINNILTPKYSEPLEKCLMEDKTPGIDIKSWLKNANKQGLPLKNISNGKLYYECPGSDNNSVAGFFADSDWAYLGCSRNPGSSGSALGVRSVREAPKI